MCILKGFPTALKIHDRVPVRHLVRQPGHPVRRRRGQRRQHLLDPTTGTYTAAAAQTTAGLQKWVFDGTVEPRLHADQRARTSVRRTRSPATRPGTTPPTGLPWAPATDGLRNITGRVNGDGTVTIWAITSTVSGNGDQGADPNKLVAITDQLSATSPRGRGELPDRPDGGQRRRSCAGSRSPRAPGPLATDATRQGGGDRVSGHPRICQGGWPRRSGGLRNRRPDPHVVARGSRNPQSRTP